MLLNCTRLTHGCTSLRVSQIRHAVTAINSHNNQLCLLRPRQQDNPFLVLLRHSLYVPAARQPVALTLRPRVQQLLTSVSTRWLGRVQIPRRGLGLAKAKAKGKKRDVIFPSPKMPKSEYGRLFILAKEEKYVLLAGVLCLVLSSAITMSVPYFLGKVIDVVFNKSGMTEEALAKLREHSFMLFLIFVVGGFANFARVYLFGTASLRMVRFLRSKLYRSMLLQETGWFDTKGTGELINRLSNDTFHVGNSLSQNLSDGLRAIAMIIVGTGMMIFTSLQLTLVSAGVVPAMAGLAIVYGRYVRRITRLELDKYAEIFKYAEERFGNVKTVKTFCRELHECSVYDKQLDEALEIGYKEVHAKSIFFGLTGFSGNFIIISVLYYGGTLVLDGQLTIGALTAFMLYAGYVAISLNGVSTFYSQLNKGIGAAQRIWDIMDRKYEIQIDQGIIPSVKPMGELTFKGVDFNFPSRVDSKVLSDFHLTLLPGKTTAIVGRSGSGKTTIVSLILRLYDPQMGAVLLDGMDLRNINVHWLRSNVGAVSQEPVLFSGSIRENIMYGVNPGTVISEEEFQNVIRESHVDEFVQHFPEGLETLVGQRGMMLSGGQKQRVAIARALIKDPIILILDEATSALDAVSEDLVQKALDRLIKGRTVLTIAHRLSTIRDANQIAVLDSGQIIEIGTYDELISKEQGAFKELVGKQTFAAGN